MAVTANETSRVAFGMDDRTTLQVPVPPASLVEHSPKSVLDPFQLPRTVTPFSRLCLTSCAVIRTVADQVPVFPLVSATPSRLPTCTLGGSTLTMIARALLLELTSASFCVAVRMCPLVATPAVFQLKVRVALAPAASPGIVWVPSVTPPVPPSVSTTSKVVVTSCPPTFCTVTTTGAVSPCVTRDGAVILARARSAGAVFTVTTTERVLLAALSSVRLCVATRVWPPSAAPVVLQLNVRVAVAPTASPVTVWVPIVTPAVASVKTTLKLVLTFSPPTFWTVTPTGAVLPCDREGAAEGTGAEPAVGGIVNKNVTDRGVLAARWLFTQVYGRG